MAEGARDQTRRRHFVLVALLVVTCLFGARGIGDESAVMLAGDMARYVMNGVFIRDLIADGGATSYGELVRYAELYYARYPALSLGHHPPVTYFSVVPFYWVFGVTALAARLAALAWFCAAAVGLFAVASRLFNWQVGGWASAIFVTNLVVLRAGQYLLSEMPMTALVLWSLYALLVFCETRRPALFMLFVALVAASVGAKQLAILMTPVYALVVVQAFGWRTFLTRRALIATGLSMALIVPLAIVTIGLSPSNYAWVYWNVTALFGGGDRMMTVDQILWTIITTHLTLPAMAATLGGLVLLALRNRRRFWLMLGWILCTVGGSLVVAGAIEPARYAFVAIPAYSLVMAALIKEAGPRRMQIAAAAVLSLVLGVQVWNVRDIRPSGAGGYEAAAEYVLSQNREPAVLYQSYIDTGYFVFFTRKHDPARRQVVLRSDKLFGWGSTNHEQDRNDVYAMLQQFGVRWVITEAKPIEPGRRSALYEVLDGPRFIERRRFPVVSTTAPGLELIVYEFIDARPAQLDAIMRIDLPLGSRDFGITLRDLVGPVK